MIFYFTGCGNSLLVAQRIADAIHDCLVQLPTDPKNFEVNRGENLGFISPTYFFGLPTVVREFLAKACFKLGGNNYVFTVCTFGTTTGMVSRQAASLLIANGIHVDAQYSVKMVDVWTPLFNLRNKARTRRKTELVLPHIDKIAQRIAAKDCGNYDRTTIWYLVAQWYYREYEKKRLTFHFHVMTERCISCGLCARKCPVQAITLDDESHPEWTRERCALCLRCLHHCPTFAIQYGRKTRHHGQFVNPFANPEDSKISNCRYNKNIKPQV